MREEMWGPLKGDARPKKGIKVARALIEGIERGRLWFLRRAILVAREVEGREKVSRRRVLFREGVVRDRSRREWAGKVWMIAWEGICGLSVGVEVWRRRVGGNVYPLPDQEFEGSTVVSCTFGKGF